MRRLSRREQDYRGLEDEQEQSREGAKAGIPTSVGCGTHADRENARVPAMTALLMLVGCQARSSEGNQNEQNWTFRFPILAEALRIGWEFEFDMLYMQVESMLGKAQ